MGQRGRHRLLGHPEPVQHQVEFEAYAKATGTDESEIYKRLDKGRNPSAVAPALAWRLLLQLDTDPNSKMMWGDCGKLYFMLSQDALRNRRFEETTLVLQCT